MSLRHRLRDMFKVIDPARARNYISILPAAGDDRLCSLNPDDIKTLFRDNGALLLRGFQLELAAFTDFSSHFCSRFVRNESGKRLNISGDGTTQTVNLGQEALPLHPELSRVPWRPDIAWFACASPAGASASEVSGAWVVATGSTSMAAAGSLTPPRATVATQNRRHTPRIVPRIAGILCIVVLGICLLSGDVPVSCLRWSLGPLSGFPTKESLSIFGPQI